MDLSAKLFGGFEDVGFGARASGMAEAFVAVADDNAASFYNPAGLAQIHRKEFSADHNEMLKGLSDGGQSFFYFIKNHPARQN